MSDLPRQTSMLSRARRNHALEHATLHVLAAGRHGLRVMAHSSPWGFRIYGDLSREAVMEAAQEGLRRLQDGQRRMAIHPNCGSNLVTAATLAGTGAFLALGGRSTGWRSRLARLPLACAAAAVGIVLARPLGSLLQARLTTEADVGDLRIVGVTRAQHGGLVVHHVHTEG